jgi:hypothetical protein
MKKYSRLILVLALFLVGCVTQYKNKAFNWAGHSCVFTGEYDAPGFFSTASYPPEYNGTFRCTNPDGSNLTCPNTGQPAERVEFTARVTYPRDITEKNFLSSIGCSATAAATSTPTASPQPIATFTPMPTATPAALLSGEVSACSTKDGFINFKLATVSPLVNESDVILTINGTQVSCTFAGSDNSLLSCPLPAGLAFPAQIVVNIGTSPVNDFVYDGGGCVTQTGSGGGGGGGDVVPTPKLGD